MQPDHRPGVTRRRFLQATATVGMAGAVGARPTRASARCRPGTVRSQVVVLGGGMGGLAAAHELIERGFEVTVLEGKALGGKARSMGVPGTGTRGRRDLPGEHGFRFFPGFYHHVPDSMRRIPLPGGGVVHDKLVAASTTSFARAGRADTLFYTEPPPSEERNLEQLLRFVHGLAVGGGTIPPEESAWFAKQLVLFMTSSEERRYGQFEYSSWWDFVGAASRSEEYQKVLASGLTRNLVAAKADAASTRTIGRIAEAFITNVVYRDRSQGEGPPDQILAGPTSDVWIDPWAAHLTRLGVSFQVGYTVEGLEMSGGRVTGARVRGPSGDRFLVEGDWFVCALPVERARQLWTPQILRADPQLEGMDHLVVDWMNGIQFYLDRQLEAIRGHYSYVDSPWALTSLAQEQFWDDIDLRGYGDGRVRDILSVDISNWDAPGILYGRPARECTREEIAQETWAQIKQHLNDEGEGPIIDQALLTWYLDPAISIAPNADTTNDEPLLINTIGSWDHRPGPVTDIPNLLLASDYVRTDIDLATMEAANEAARAAVNAILDTSDSSADPVPMYQLFTHPELLALRAVDAERYRAGQPHVLDSPNPPSLPWPLQDLPDIERDAGVVTPVPAEPVTGMPPAAATTDAAIQVRDDLGLADGCDTTTRGGTTPRGEPGRGDTTSRDTRTDMAPAGAVLPATGGSRTGLVAGATLTALAAIVSRRNTRPDREEHT